MRRQDKTSRCSQVPQAKRRTNCDIGGAGERVFNDIASGRTLRLFMNNSNTDIHPASSDGPKQSASPTLDPIGQNTDSILAFYMREERNITFSQRLLESVGGALGSPLGLGVILMCIVLWILANVLAKHLGITTFDPPPFSWLQGAIGLGALITTIVVLVKQNRLAKMEERRAHLELQVNLLTEQKATKIINLLEELRHDLPMIEDRHDAEATAFQLPTDPESVLAVLDDRLDTGSPKNEKLLRR
ncbi:MAG: DUF1003 domain-containing protein [Burkholderiales bacterium]